MKQRFQKARAFGLGGGQLRFEPIADGHQLVDLSDDLHDAAVVVVGFDNRERNIGLVIEDAVGALRLAAGDELAADDDAAFGEADLFAKLRHLVPPGLAEGGGDGFRTDVPLAELLLVQPVLVYPLSRRLALR